MTDRDRRPTIRESVYRSPVLSYAEKVYLLRMVDLDAERDPETGERRPGAHRMRADGHYAHHVDYIAAAMGASSHAVERAQFGCLRKGYLSMVHRPTFGRPTTYQALIVRPAENVALEGRENRGPYVPRQRAVSTAKTAGLTYLGETPDQPGGQAGHATTESHGSGESHRRGRVRASSALAALCQWHVGEPGEVCKYCPSPEEVSL